LTVFIFVPFKGFLLQRTEKMTADIFPAFNPENPPQNILSVSGAGDW
jgi:hypothetical protein